MLRFVDELPKGDLMKAFIVNLFHFGAFNMGIARSITEDIFLNCYSWC